MMLLPLSIIPPQFILMFSALPKWGRDKVEDSYKETTVRNFSFNFNIQPSIINARPLTLKRQKELYKEIAPYVDLPFRNITCPKPNERETND
ncbi:unnamed protein product [Rhizophagus irregularis]|nr:unnamed protein product [Rhizophagus irregularis]